MTYDEAMIGQRVRYRGCSVIGKCTGVITQIFAPDPSPFDVGHAIVKPDELPHPWPYVGDDFAPTLGELEAIDNAPK